MTLEHALTLTLGEADAAFRDGRMDEATARAYCNAWNNGPFKFTIAKVEGSRIVNRNDPGVVWRR